MTAFTAVTPPMLTIQLIQALKHNQHGSLKLLNRNDIFSSLRGSSPGKLL